eukprot:6175687-Pleurochrysis_carterae.AAC.2
MPASILPLPDKRIRHLGVCTPSDALANSATRRAFGTTSAEWLAQITAFPMAHDAAFLTIFSALFDCTIAIH